MDEALELALVFGGNGNHQPSVANRERYIVSHPAAAFGGAQHSIQFLADSNLFRNEPSPNLRQFGRGVVADQSALVDDAVDGFGHAAFHSDGGGVLAQQRISLGCLIGKKPQTTADGI